MVVVAGNHILKVFFPALLKGDVQAKAGAAHNPLVKGFLHNQHTQLIAGVQERRAKGVVRGADGIKAAFLHQANPAALGGGMVSRTENAQVMVDAAALHRAGLTVQQQTGLAAYLNRADANALLCRVGGAVGGDVHAQGVEGGRFRRPRRNAVGGKLHRSKALCRSQHLPLCVRQLIGYAVRRAGQCGADLYHSAAAVQRGGNSADTVRRDADGACHVQPHAAVDAAAHIPAGVGLGAVVGVDGDFIIARLQQIRHLHPEAGIGVVVLGNRLFVQPDLGNAGNALKFQPEALADDFRFHGKALAVVKTGAGHKALIQPGRGLGRACLLHGVVMGQACFFPALQHTHHQGVLQAAFKIFPVLVQVKSLHNVLLCSEVLVGVLFACLYHTELCPGKTVIDLP